MTTLAPPSTVPEQHNGMEQEKEITSEKGISQVNDEIKATQFVFKEMLSDEEAPVPTYDQLEVSEKL